METCVILATPESSRRGYEHASGRRGSQERWGVSASDVYSVRTQLADASVIAQEEDTMRLLVVRHAIAMDRAEFARSGKDDSERPLTKDGRNKMAKGARGLRAV